MQLMGRTTQRPLRPRATDNLLAQPDMTLFGWADELKIRQQSPTGRTSRFLEGGTEEA